ncbi:MAG: VWA domain-containing protein, partial [bacterium]
TGQILDAIKALEIIGMRRKDDVYRALYAIFVSQHAQAELFDQVFEIFWRSPRKLPEMMHLLLPNVEVPSQKKTDTSLRAKQAFAETEQGKTTLKPPQKNEEKVAVDIVVTYSPVEILRTKDFADFSAEEILEAKKLFAKMRWPISQKQTRRRKQQATGQYFDSRRSMRAALRSSGEMVKLFRRGRKIRQRPLVVLCDISGSMERYSRMLLHFLHVVSSEMQTVETFVFGTRLSRISRYLRQRDIDDAVELVSKSVNDWGGGTKIGACLKDFNYLWSRRVLRSGAVVIVISDGWDRGDIPLLEREIARLSRSCYRLIWLNPLLGYEDYKPLTKGIRAALPYIDDFLPVHNLESLEQLGVLLGNLRTKPAHNLLNRYHLYLLDD